MGIGSSVLSEPIPSSSEIWLVDGLSRWADLKIMMGFD
jgi:hypothetical protein